MESNPITDNKGKKEIEIIEVRGIPYYVDKQNRVYKHEELFTPQPTIIGQLDRVNKTIAFLTPKEALE